MAQVIEFVSGQPVKTVLKAKNLNVSVPATGNTTLLELPVRGMTRLLVQIAVATQALDAFLIQGRPTPDASLVTLYSTAAAFTSPDGGVVVAASGDLTTLAAGSTGWVLLNVPGFWDVKILASAAVDSAVVQVYAGGL
jgi:hypothetical protein